MCDFFLVSDCSNLLDILVFGATGSAEDESDDEGSAAAPHEPVDSLRMGARAAEYEWLAAHA